MKNRILLLTAFITILATASFAQLPSYVPSNGLVGWWPFTGNANDISGNNLNGTITGASLTTDRFSNANGAYNFASTGQHIDFFSSNTWCSGNHTISFWFKGAYISGKDQFIFAKRNSCLGGAGEPSYFEARIKTTGNLIDIGWGGSNGGYFFNTPFTPNQWNNIVYVVSGSNAYLYLNGVQVSSIAYTTATSNNSMLRAGNHSCPFTGDDFIGNFDDLGIWNRDLTQQEITGVYASSNCNAIDISTGLFASYPFSSNANDISGNNLNGTVTGASLTADRFGNANGAYNFASTGQHIDFFSSNTWCSGNHTISFWFKGAYISGKDQFIFAKRNSCLGGAGEPSYFEARIKTTGNLIDIGWGGSNGGYFFNTPFTPNQWNNIVYVASGSNAYLYLNGVQVNSIAYTTATSNNSMLRAGNHSCPFTGDDFIGNFDDLGIWNRDLTDCDIDSVYHLTNQCTGVTASITPQGNTTFCAGNSVALNASTGSSYSWSNSATTQNITATQSNTYTVTVTDANSCTASASVSVTVNALPTVAPTAAPAAICNGNSTTLAANATAGSGTISTYAWSSGIGGNSSGGSVSPTGNTTYTVTVTNSNSCSATGSVSVTVNAKPTVAPSATPPAFCIGGSTTLAANAAAGSGTISTYAWSSGVVGNLSGGSVSPTGNATYNVTVTNSNSCSVTGSVSVTVYPLPTVTFTLPAFINNNASTLTLNGSPAGGSYAGTGGLSGNTLNPSQAGLGNKAITYTYTNGNGCTKTASSTTVLYDTTGIVCTQYDTTSVTVNDTTYISVSTTDTLIINVNLTGIAPPNNTNAVSVYPNPAHDRLIVDNGNYTAMAGYSVKITNAIGQIVFNQAITQQQFNIDLNTFGGNGTYILYVLDASQAIKSVKEIVLQ